MAKAMSAPLLTVEVAVAAPVWHPLTYRAPADLAPLIGPLTRLKVPLRGRPRLGFALAAPAPSPAQGGPAGEAKGLQPVLDVLDEPGATAWPAGMLGFFTRAAAHYQTPLGQALAWALPAGLGAGAAGPPRSSRVAVATARPGRESDLPRQRTQAAELLALLQAQGPQDLPSLRRRWPRATALVAGLEKAGWAGVTHRPLVHDLAGNPLWPEPEPEQLTEDQQAALAQLLPVVEGGGFHPFLLYGVTGSGKTELYLAALKRALAQGRTALILAPEIGLVLRLEGLIKDRLGAETVAVLHSGLSPAARRAEWRAAAAGRARVVVGARSAVFAPLENIGLICVDEEQDEAYKQEDRLRYHARDLALLRGQEEGAAVVLGSATPAVTTWYRAQQGTGLTRLDLPRRVSRAEMPRMMVVDMRRQPKPAGGFLSPPLMAALKDTLARGEQAALFLNRRGFAAALICPACGKPVGCPACSLSLTLHRGPGGGGGGRLVCHTCGHSRPVPPACPNCGEPGEAMLPLGLGTEQVADRLGELLPGVAVARLDADAAGSPARLREVLGAVSRGEVQVVVGTQMITKGHHFPQLTLVGVLLADQALAVPDFRAAERAFHLLTQVAGRAGRAGGPSLVMVQAFDPHHHAIQAALDQNPEAFYAQELDDRRALGYPPFVRLVGLKVSSPSQSAAQSEAGRLAGCLSREAARLEPRALVLGPAPAPVPRVHSRWRQLILLKAPSAAAAGRVLRAGLGRLGRLAAGVSLAVDVDPVSLA